MLKELEGKKREGRKGGKVRSSLAVWSTVHDDDDGDGE